MKILEEYKIIIGVLDYRDGIVMVTGPADGVEGSIKKNPMMLVLNQRMREGYELLGGITFVAGDMYAQAIVKWKEE